MPSKLMFMFLLTETIPCFDQVVEMREISPTLANGEHQPGLESQGRAASMPRLAAETQVSKGDPPAVGAQEWGRSSVPSLCFLCPWKLLVNTWFERHAEPGDR